MNWEEALELILHHIVVGLHLDPDLQFRTIVDGPNYHCNTYNYNGALGFRVQIGNNTFINIPIIMLETLFNATLANNGIYNRAVFGQHFHQQLTNHGCHVHTVGQIFEISGIAERVGNNYEIQ